MTHAHVQYRVGIKKHPAPRAYNVILVCNGARTKKIECRSCLFTLSHHMHSALKTRAMATVCARVLVAPTRNQKGDTVVVVQVLQTNVILGLVWRPPRSTQHAQQRSGANAFRQPAPILRIEAGSHCTFHACYLDRVLKQVTFESASAVAANQSQLISTSAVQGAPQSTELQAPRLCAHPSSSPVIAHTPSRARRAW